VTGIFQTGYGELFALECPGTTILLISASWVSGITDVSHQHPASMLFLHWGGGVEFEKQGLFLKALGSQKKTLSSIPIVLVRFPSLWQN
jgi:hypothetical protein